MVLIWFSDKFAFYNSLNSHKIEYFQTNTLVRSLDNLFLFWSSTSASISDYTISFCVCVKRITLCNCLCSSFSSSSSSSRFYASRVRNIGVNHTRDFGPSHNVKNHLCCNITSKSRQKMDSGILKNNSSVRPELTLEKSCCSAKIIQTLILLLSTTNYSLFIYLFVHLSTYYIYIYIYICVCVYIYVYTPGGRSFAAKVTSSGWRLLLNLGDPF